MVTTSRTVIISADSHVSEPVDLWFNRLPQTIRDRAQHVDTRSGGRYLADTLQLISQGKTSRPAGAGESGAPATADVARRLRDMQQDGISAEVIYPTVGLHVLGIPDPELQVACARVYNDWAHEIFGRHFDTFMPAAVLPAIDIPAALSELERVTGLGFRAAAIPAAAPEGQPYNDPAYEPFWSAAEAAQMALSFHVGTGHSPILARGAGGAVINYAYVGIVAQQTVCYLTASGILARHPGLHTAIVEGGAGWLAWVLERMDEAYTEHQMWVQPKLDELPSFYYKRQGHASFQYDLSALNNIRLTGPDCLIWGSDYPHPEGTWPHSQEKLAEQFAGMPEDARRKITGETAARIYRFPV